VVPRRGLLAEAEKEFVEREREIIESALEASGGRVSGENGAAATLGVPAQTLDSKIANLRIDKRKLKAAKPAKAQS
jgi:transcriptional regulator with GAF, ATPase, and Fis domain